MSTKNLNEEAKLAFQELYADLPDLRGIIIATTDGLPIISDLKGGLSAEKISALVATALGIGKRVMPSLGMGEAVELTISSNDGKMLMYTIGNGAVLCLLTPKSTNLGMVFIKASQLTQRFTPFF